jgi:hypothetical protein
LKRGKAQLVSRTEAAAPLNFPNFAFPSLFFRISALADCVWLEDEKKADNQKSIWLEGTEHFSGINFLSLSIIFFFSTSIWPFFAWLGLSNGFICGFCSLHKLKSVKWFWD